MFFKVAQKDAKYFGFSCKQIIHHDLSNIPNLLNFQSLYMNFPGKNFEFNYFFAQKSIGTLSKFCLHKLKTKKCDMTVVEESHKVCCYALSGLH